MKNHYVRKQLKQFAFGTLVAITTILNSQAFAGDRVGNGGDAIVCPNGKVELLDHYEALKRGQKIDIAGLTLREKVQTVINRFKSFDYLNGEAIEKTAHEMVSDLEMSDYANYKYITMSTDELIDIEDSLETSILNGCSKEQLVVNRKAVYSQDKKFEIRSDLWVKMDLENQAMVVIHEAIYNRLINTGAKDSRFARYLNGYFSQRGENINYADYIADLIQRKKELPKLKYKIKSIKCAPFEIGNIDCRNNFLSLLKIKKGRVYYQNYPTALIKTNWIDKNSKKFKNQNVQLVARLINFNSKGEIVSAAGYLKAYSNIRFQELRGQKYVTKVKMNNGYIHIKRSREIYVNFNHDLEIVKIRPFFSEPTIKSVTYNSVKYTGDIQAIIIEKENIIEVIQEDL